MTDWASHNSLVNYLYQTRLLGWNITPFLGNWLQHFSWISLWPLANLFWYINTFFHGCQLWYKLCHMRTLNKFSFQNSIPKRYWKYLSLLTFSLWHQVTDFIRNICDNSFNFFVALLWSGNKSTSSRTTQSLRNLLTFGHRIRLGPELLGNGTNLPWPLTALFFSHITTLHLYKNFDETSLSNTWIFSHFSSYSVLHLGTSSTTVCGSFLVQHSLTYSVRHTSGPDKLQSWLRKELMKTTAEIKYKNMFQFLVGSISAFRECKIIVSPFSSETKPI